MGRASRSSTPIWLPTDGDPETSGGRPCGAAVRPPRRARLRTDTRSRDAGVLQELASGDVTAQPLPPARKLPAATSRRARRRWRRSLRAAGKATACSTHKSSRHFRFRANRTLNRHRQMAESDPNRKWSKPLFDHLVGERDHQRRNFETERFCGL
jgi:hypothetical protein